ncbi:MAG: dTDP-4-dehydrorhamnose reductase [Gammaproteobacteria bacterium]|nr:dTDP-4-dehydrorhamnose reductase [Gammaproteobacteria bacterium]MDE0225687.1 dTDP-4-dehydrorhamnose reductase [Gammaproteobacteria bacterium]MDE0452575.1 dTDP-4-dehydrorhamnose reductase [Gammaproteobacteria bacterium]
MRVVLLGPNGQLGSDIQRWHEKTGAPFELLALGRDRLDVASTDAIERRLEGIDFDALINCTGYHRTDEVEDNATLAVAVNAHAVKTLAEVCASQRARLIHISTDYVFGGDAGRADPLMEDDPVAPVNVYGASKALGETLANLVLDDLVILRVASLFGVAGASGKGGNFVETMIRVGTEKGELRVVYDQTMSPTSTADVARVIIRILVEDCAPGLYHVVNDGAASWFDFAREIVARARIDSTVSPCTSEEFPTRAARPRYSVLDNTKTSRAIGPLPAWQAALDEYLRAKGHIH